MNPEREANLEVIKATDGVMPFPEGEASEADYRNEMEKQREETKARVEAMVPYLRIWFKRTIGQDMSKANRYGNAFVQKLQISWVLETLTKTDVLARLGKAHEAEKKETPAPWPTEGVDHWTVMKAFSAVVRRYNYGMKMGGAGYMVLFDSNHKVSQSVSTGDNVWTLPTELTFTYWKVENGDYENPWTLEWIQHPDDPNQRIQVKKYIRTAAVLKPWEKKVVSDTTRFGKIAMMKEGEQLTFKFDHDHESEAADEIDGFLEQLSRISIDSNVRYYTMQPDPFRLIVAHQGKLYR